MERKKPPKTKNRTSQAEDRALQSMVREDKILNAMVNTSIILMSTMMGAFTQVITNATNAMASGMAAAMGGKKAEDKVNEKIKQKLPEIDEKMKAMISDIRKDIYTQIRQKRKDLEPLLSDLVFEAGPKIIEKYDFNLPKLTQELDESALAQYSQLLVTEDSSFLKMFKELTKWLDSLPKIPDQTKTKSSRGEKSKTKTPPQ